MLEDPMREFDPRLWPQLRAKLMLDWPKSISVIGWIETRRRWFETEPEKCPYHVLCPEGDPDNGIVTFGKTAGRVYYLSIYNLTSDFQKLKLALLKTRMIDWSEKPICGVPEEFTEWFKTFLEMKEYRVYQEETTNYFYQPLDVAMRTRIDPGEGFYVSPLREGDIVTMDSLWPHRFQGSRAFLAELRRLNFGIGVYCKSSDDCENDELVAWCVEYEYGDCGCVQTVEGRRRRGHARTAIATMALVQACRRGGADCDRTPPYAYVDEGNAASERLFAGIGYVKAGHCDWVYFEERRGAGAQCSVARP